MADLNIIYRIAADISGLQDGVKRAADSAQGMETTFKKVGTAIAGALTIGAIVNFGKALLDDADALVKLSDKTDLSIGALRELRRVGEDTSVSIDRMAAAIVTLQRNIGGGDASVVAALKAMGLSYEAIRRLSPEEMFFQIAGAAKNVENQVELVRLGSVLMGRSFAEILPAIKEGFEEVDHAAEQTTRTLDAASDSLGRIYRAFRDLAGGVLASTITALGNIVDNFVVLAGGEIGAAEATAVLEQTLKKFNATADTAMGSVRKLGDETAAYNLTAKEQTDLERKLGKELEETNKDRKEAGALTDAATLKQKKWNESIAEATHRMHLNVSALHRYIAAIPGAISGTGRLSNEILLLTSRSLGLENVLVREMPSAFGVMDRAMFKTEQEVNHLANAITYTFRQALGQLPGIFNDGFDGVLGRLKSIGRSLLEGIIQNILDPILDYISGWVNHAIGLLMSVFGFKMPSGFTLPGGGVPSPGGVPGGSPSPGPGLSPGGLIGGLILGTLGGFFINDLINNNTGETPPSGYLGNVDEFGNPVYTPPDADAGRLPPPEAPGRLLGNHPTAQSLTGNPIYDARRFDPSAFPGFAEGSGGVQDFGAGTLVMAHGREVIATEPQWNAQGSGRHDAAILARLESIREAILSRAHVSVQVGGRELMRATVDAMNNGQYVTEMREVLGVP